MGTFKGAEPPHTSSPYAKLSTKLICLLHITAAHPLVTIGPQGAVPHDTCISVTAESLRAKMCLKPLGCKMMSSCTRTCCVFFFSGRRSRMKA